MLDIRKANQSRKRSDGGEPKNSSYYDLGVLPHVQILDDEDGQDTKEEIGGSVEYRGDVGNDDQDHGADAVSFGVW